MSNSPSSVRASCARNANLVLVAAYSAFSALWILLSDRMVTWLFPEPAGQASAQTVKGWLFVAVTSVLLYAVLRRLQIARDAALARETAALRERAEAAQLLQTLVAHSSDAIFVKDRAGRYVLFNHEAARVTGRAAAQVLGRDDGAVFSPEQAAMIRANDERVMGQARAQTFEEELDTADGRVVFLATKGPLRGPDGVTGLFGISRDITDMVQARRALAEREQRYRTLFEAHPQPLWVFDRATLRFLDVNAAAIARYGYAREEFLDMTLADLRPPEHRPALAQNLASQRPGERYGERVSGPWVHRRKDGSLIEVEISSNDIEVDGGHARLVMALDVTDRVRLQRERDAAFDVLARQQAELVRSELRYRLAAMGGDVWEWDIGTGRVDYPGLFWQRLGHAPPAAADQASMLAGLLHPDDRLRWRSVLRRHLRAREPYALEFRARNADGAWRWFHTRGQAVWDADGRATYMAGTTFDVTDRHQAEHALLRTQHELSELAQRLLSQERETTTRLAHVLHDQLGQTLGSARLQLDLAISRAGGAGGGERLQRASGLVGDAIAQVRSFLVELRPPLLREQGLVAALDNELRRGLGDGAGPDIQLQASAGAGAARWPEDVEYAVYMIAREGLSNALRHARAQQVVLALDGDGSSLRLSLRDDGRGIEEADRVDRPGHLGLVGMRERALAIGARIEVQRRADGGTEVLVQWRASQP